MADSPDHSLVPGKGVRFSATGELQPTTQECLDAAAKLRLEQLPHERYAGYVPIVGALTVHGYRQRTIAAALKLSVNAVEWCQREARRRGDLKQTLEDALLRIDNEAVPLAIESLLGHLRRKDKELTWKVLAGRGMFPHLTKAKADGPAQHAPMAFQFNFVMPDGAAGQAPADDAVLPGQIVGEERSE